MRKQWMRGSLGMALAAGWLLAAPAGADDPGAAGRAESLPDPQNAVLLERLTERLALSEEQQKKIASILDEESQKMRQLRTQRFVSRESREPRRDLRDQMQAVRKRRMERIEAELTEQQAAEFATMRVEQRRKMEQWRGRGPKGVGPPPSGPVQEPPAE